MEIEKLRAKQEEEAKNKGYAVDKKEAKSERMMHRDKRRSSIEVSKTWGCEALTLFFALAFPFSFAYTTLICTHSTQCNFFRFAETRRGYYGRSSENRGRRRRWRMMHVSLTFRIGAENGATRLGSTK